MSYKIRKFIKIYGLTFLIALLIGGGLFCLFFFTKDQSFMDACNATSVTAIILVCVGLLMWINREGFFDFAAFGFKQFGSMLFRKEANEFNDFAKYKEYKFEVRKHNPKYFLPVIVAGLIFGIAFIVLRIQL